MNKPLIGAVSYLNTKPLVQDLAELANDYEIAFDLPSRLADDLQKGVYQVALIPSIEVIRQSSENEATAVIVSDACIGCRGPVWSVKIMSRVAPENIKSLALDEGSRTSKILAQIILNKKFDCNPECIPLAIDAAWQKVDADAVLIIGDRAMKATDERFAYELDLGQIWNQWTGLPFVFAVWTAMSNSNDQIDFENLSRILSTSRDRGVEQLETISSDLAADYGLTKSECLSYLRDNLHFSLGDQEKAGLQLFYDYATELSLVETNHTPHFHTAAV